MEHTANTHMSQNNRRNTLIAANWKMNGSRQLVRSMLTALADSNEALHQIEIAIFPPYPYLDQAGTLLKNSPIHLGAQNLCTEATGAFTGEISGSMLREFNCRYVLVGHSERRQYYYETDEIIAEKFMRAQHEKLIPILCVGETLAEKERGITETVVVAQLNEILEKLGPTAFNHAIIAYEPIWAIGTGLTATPTETQNIHRFIRSFLAETEKDIANSLQILYGGSVKADNIADLLAMPDIDGALVGGASLKEDEFLKMLQLAAERN